MFTDNQIEFMENIGLELDFAALSDDDYCKIEDMVGDIYTEEAQAHPEEATEKIQLCESILDRLSE